MSADVSSMLETMQTTYRAISYSERVDEANSVVVSNKNVTVSEAMLYKIFLAATAYQVIMIFLIQRPQFYRVVIQF